MNLRRKKALLALLLLLFALVLLLMSCTDKDVVTNPGKDLVFSADTLTFDTLFSETVSTTAWLKIRNTGKNPVRIAKISLRSGGQSGFHINLDGENNTHFEEVEIPAKDSLFLFVQANLPQNGQTGPVQINDAVLFETDGPTRQIVLNGWSWDAHQWKGKVLAADTTLTADKPFVIRDSLVVAENATLTILPGTRLFFHDKAFLRVKGRIKAQGTLADPIVFRGDRLDNVTENFPYDKYPGQWYFIRLDATSFGNVLDYVDIHGAYYGIIADSSSAALSKLKLTNSVVHNMVYSCLYLNSASVEIGNSQITNSGSYTVALIGGKARFTHCTIANYERLVSRDGPAVVLVNYLSNPKDTSVITAYPMDAEFRNSIIMGSISSELGLVKRAGIPWEAVFRNSLIRSTALSADLATTSGCRFAGDAAFHKLGYEEDKYVFDFSLDSASVARNMGFSDYSVDYPLDIKGNSRMKDENPDAGAFEWVFKK